MKPIVFLCVGAYFVASIPFGALIARGRGIDIRRHGSGNVGATNIGRVLGRKWGFLVLMLDALKGAIPMLTADWYVRHVTNLPHWGPAAANWILFLTGTCALAGSIAPIFFGFRGGKGVATSLGIFASVPSLLPAAAIGGAVWVGVRALSGFVSMASVIAAVAVPPAYWLILRLSNRPLSREYPLLILCLLMAILVIVRHRSNLGRLLTGTELGGAAAPETGPDPDGPSGGRLV